MMEEAAARDVTPTRRGVKGVVASESGGSLSARSRLVKSLDDDDDDDEGDEASTTPVKGGKGNGSGAGPSASPFMSTSDSAGSASEMLAASLSAIKLEDDDDDEDESEGSRRAKRDTDEGEVSEDSANDGLALVGEGLEAIRAQIFEMQEKRHRDVFAKVGDRVEGSKGEGADEGGPETHASAMDRAMIKTNGLLETVSERIRTVDGQLTKLEEREKAEGDEDGCDEFGVKKKLGHGKRGSVSSLSSLGSFDEAFFSPPGGVSGLRKRFLNMLEDWAKLQQEVKAAEEELSADKYMAIFTSISAQTQDIMDSLDKALAQCHDFVFTFNRDRAGAALGGADSDWAPEMRLEELRRIKRSFDIKKQSYGPACESMFSAMERGVKERSVKNGSILRQFSELKTRWRSLRERTARMDKELKRIETSLMREASSPASSNSLSLHNSPAGSLHSSAAREQSHLGYGASPSRKLLQPKSPKRNASNISGTSTIRTHGMRTSSASSASLSSSLNRSPSEAINLASPSSSPPVKPPKSVYRMSMLDTSLTHGKENTNTTANHSRSLSTDATRVQLGALRTPPRGSSVDAQAYPASTSKIPSSTSSSSLADPLERFGYPGDLRQPSTRSPKHRIRALSPNPPSSWRRSSASTSVNGQTTPLRGRDSSSTYSESQPPNVPGDSPSTQFGDADSTPDEVLLDDGVLSFSPPQQRPPRPASVAGMFYRPPSATGRYTDMEEASTRGYADDPAVAATGRSRIPRLSAGQQERPGSSLSQTSSAMTATRIPSIRSSAATTNAPPPPSYMTDRGASRDSMMTPEPTIAARARRLNLFAPASTPHRSFASFSASYAPSATSTTPRSVTPSSSSTATTTKRSSRPPPAKYNAPGSMTTSTTRPLNISKRNSSLSMGTSAAPAPTSSGRSTPLSAASLADSQRRLSSLAGSSPQVTNRSSGIRGGAMMSSSTSSSVANFRASRAAAAGNQGNASTFAGDAFRFPTSRQGAHSIISGGGPPSASSRTASGIPYAQSATSGRVTPTFSDSGASAIWGRGAGRAALQRSRPYRPKDRNDPLDAEVAHIVNQLGVQTERVDGQPAGGPNRMVRYDIGGRVIVCKLLELVSSQGLRCDQGPISDHILLQHRPSGMVGGQQQEKARKVLTRVGGGWIDLEQYVLSRMGSM